MQRQTPPLPIFAIAGNGTDHAIVIFGNSVIDILSTQALTLTAQDFLFT